MGKNEIIATVSLALPVNRDTIEKFNILLWWKLKRSDPHIPHHVAHGAFGFVQPASNSKSESNFLDAWNKLTKKRFGLKPTTMKDILFVRSNQNLV